MTCVDFLLRLVPGSVDEYAGSSSMSAATVRPSSCGGLLQGTAQNLLAPAVLADLKAGASCMLLGTRRRAVTWAGDCTLRYGLGGIGGDLGEQSTGEKAAAVLSVVRALGCDLEHQGQELGANQHDQQQRQMECSLSGSLGQLLEPSASKRAGCELQLMPEGTAATGGASWRQWQQQQDPQASQQHHSCASAAAGGSTVQEPAPAAAAAGRLRRSSWNSQEEQGHNMQLSAEAQEGCHGGSVSEETAWSGVLGSQGGRMRGLSLQSDGRAAGTDAAAIDGGNHVSSSCSPTFGFGVSGNTGVGDGEDCIVAGPWVAAASANLSRREAALATVVIPPLQSAVAGEASLQNACGGEPVDNLLSRSCSCSSYGSVDSFQGPPQAVAHTTGSSSSTSTLHRTDLKGHSSAAAGGGFPATTGVQQAGKLDQGIAKQQPLNVGGGSGDQGAAVQLLPPLPCQAPPAAADKAAAVAGSFPNVSTSPPLVPRLMLPATQLSTSNSSSGNHTPPAPSQSYPQHQQQQEPDGEQLLGSCQQQSQEQMQHTPRSAVDTARALTKLHREVVEACEREGRPPPGEQLLQLDLLGLRGRGMEAAPVGQAQSCAHARHSTASISRSQVQAPGGSSKWQGSQGSAPSAANGGLPEAVVAHRRSVTCASGSVAGGGAGVNGLGMSRVSQTIQRPHVQIPGSCYSSCSSPYGNSLTAAATPPSTTAALTRALSRQHSSKGRGFNLVASVVHSSKQAGQHPLIGEIAAVAAAAHSTGGKASSSSKAEGTSSTKPLIGSAKVMLPDSRAIGYKFRPASAAVAGLREKAAAAAAAAAGNTRRPSTAVCRRAGLAGADTQEARCTTGLLGRELLDSRAGLALVTDVCQDGQDTARSSGAGGWLSRMAEVAHCSGSEDQVLAKIREAMKGGGGTSTEGQAGCVSAEKPAAVGATLNGSSCSARPHTAPARAAGRHPAKQHQVLEIGETAAARCANHGLEDAAAGDWWLGDDTPRSDPLLLQLPAWVRSAIGIEARR